MVDHQSTFNCKGLYGDECAQKSNRYEQVCSLNLGMLQVSMRDRVTNIFERERGDAGSNHAPPHYGHDFRNPIAKARKAVAMMGSPAGTNGVRERATTIAAPESRRAVKEVSRGHTSPKKAAGTAASSPQAAGLPIDCAPSAPTSVKKFQKIKTPTPVSQNPDCIASGPRLSWESATPVDSSIVMCAARRRFAPLVLSKGDILTP